MPVTAEQFMLEYIQRMRKKFPDHYVFSVFVTKCIFHELKEPVKDTIHGPRKIVVINGTTVYVYTP